MGPISGFIIFSLLITVGYFIGLLTFLTDHEVNKCDMTFMFEYPQFVRIHLENDNKHKKYGLYAYSEGGLTERARHMYFTGIPVLFVPGNAGSYKQVRSSASVALRKSLNSRPGFHFDFFTVDLNDELSGLNGALLNEQMDFVNDSISRILELYEDTKYPPKSLVIIGHSMGGIIARGLLSQLPKNSTLIPLVITLATPHVRPPVAFDVYMTNYYSKMQKNTSIPDNSTVVALSGGYNDFMIAPFITNSKNFKNLHVVTTSVPLLRLPVDHKCILWCKQLVLALTRSLFDLVDLDTRQISTNASYHREVFQHHLLKNSGTKVRNAGFYKQLMRFDEDDHYQWIENLQTQYTISLLNGTKYGQFRMIRLLGEPSHEFLSILALNLEVTDWVFMCSAVYPQKQTRMCVNGFHLSQLSEIAPSIKYKRRILQINLHDLKKTNPSITHVAVRIKPTNEPVVLHIDIHNPNKRKIEVPLPRWWTFDSQIIIPETPEKVISYELILPQLQHLIQSYKLYVEPIKCGNNVHHAVASLTVPWDNQEVHKYFSEIERDSLDVRLYYSKPNGWSNSSAIIKLTLDPICTYSISVRNSFIGMLGQMARTYSTLLIANMTAVILLAFRNQLVSIESTGGCTIFFNAIKYGVKPYYILTMVKLASRGLSFKGFSRVLPLPDWHQIAEEGNDFFLLPLLLYMVSVGIVWLAALGIAVSLIFCESTFHKVITKFLARTITGAMKFSDWLIGGFHKLPCVVATFLVFLSMSTCGALALCLGCAFYFLKLTQMSQDYVEGLLVKVVKYFASKLKRQKTNENNTQEGTDSSQSSLSDDDLPARALERTEEIQPEENEAPSDEDKEKIDEVETELEETKPLLEEDKPDTIEPELNENIEETDKITKSNEKPPEYSAIFFHFTIFLLWCIIAALNIPSVLTWAHNFKFNAALQPDPSFLPGFILSLCAIPLWQLDLPKTNLLMYTQVGQICNVLAAVSLIYAPLSIYRLVYIITGAIVLITLHQLLAPARIDVVDEEVAEETSDNTETMLNTIKTKWE